MNHTKEQKKTATWKYVPKLGNETDDPRRRLKPGPWITVDKVIVLSIPILFGLLLSWAVYQLYYFLIIFLVVIVCWVINQALSIYKSPIATAKDEAVTTEGRQVPRWKYVAKVGNETDDPRRRRDPGPLFNIDRIIVVSTLFVFVSAFVWIVYKVGVLIFKEVSKFIY